MIRECALPPHVLLDPLIDNHELAALLVQALALKNLRMYMCMTGLLIARASMHSRLQTAAVGRDAHILDGLFLLRAKPCLTSLFN